MSTIWTIELPDAQQPPAQGFFLKIDDNFKLKIDDTYKLLIEAGTSSGYVVVWTQQTLGQ